MTTPASKILSASLGFPRIGAHRELKAALESHWSGRSSAEDLKAAAAALRARHWLIQQKAGIDHIPSNDFSLYDQMLDTIVLLGAVPERFGHKGGAVPLELYFAMARGRQDAPAMEMTKWFDTNYHYIVPELSADTVFALGSNKPVEDYNEAKFLGVATRPVVSAPSMAGLWAAMIVTFYLGVLPTRVIDYALQSIQTIL